MPKIQSETSEQNLNMRKLRHVMSNGVLANIRTY